MSSTLKKPVILEIESVKVDTSSDTIRELPDGTFFVPFKLREVFPDHMSVVTISAVVEPFDYYNRLYGLGGVQVVRNFDRNTKQYAEISHVRVSPEEPPKDVEWGAVFPNRPTLVHFTELYVANTGKNDEGTIYANLDSHLSDSKTEKLDDYGGLTVMSDTRNLYGLIVEPSGVGGELQTVDLADPPVKYAYNLVVGAASIAEIPENVRQQPENVTFNFLTSKILNQDDPPDEPQPNATNTDRDIKGLGENEFVYESPGFYSVWFKGDKYGSLSVMAVFGQEINYCTRTYRADYNCKDRSWSVSFQNEICDTNIYQDWNIVTAGSECYATKKVPCLNYNNNCDLVPTPAPPKLDMASICCDVCIWQFKKIYDCEKELWVCVEASLICDKPSGGNGEWAVDGCEATTTINLEIPCEGAGDCPKPDCDKAPPGPFIRPPECCENEPPPGEVNTAICEPCIGNCKFLGCSVVGFNSSIGWNTQESIVNVDLVEVQCPIPGDPVFVPEVFTGADLIGYPVYFSCGGFFFGGLLQNWTYQSNSGGRTYNVKVIDPRQILEQCVLLIDTYAGPPVRTLNYFNVYGFYEQEVYTDKNCDLFGTSESTERGMPYNKIMEALRQMNPVICTPVGANLTIDWSTFNIPVPDYFKVAGPSITILQLISDICDEAGYDFFVTLEPGDIVRIYTVSTKKYDPIEDNLFFGFNNVIDFTYGKELRITKTRNLLLGEQQHYLDVVYFGEPEQNPEAEVQYVFNGVTGEKQYSTGAPGDNKDPFEFYFGEEVDPATGEAKPIVPYKREFGQFWVDIDIRKLNVNLIIPFPVDRINICEYDIRTAMSSFESFWSWIAYEGTPSELGQAIQANWPVTYTVEAVLQRLNQSSVTIAHALSDASAVPNSARASANLHSWPPVLEDIKKVHEWIAEFGRTYYGRQYLVQLNEKVCVKPHPEDFGEKLYTDTPTNDGGWVEPGIPVMRLQDPDLGLFRTDDDRVGPFALFCNPSEDMINSGLDLYYSGNGGGDYQYTLGSGILDIAPQPPPTGQNT